MASNFIFYKISLWLETTQAIRNTETEGNRASAEVLVSEAGGAEATEEDSTAPCTRPSAMIATPIAKCLFAPTAADPFCAATASNKTTSAVDVRSVLALNVVPRDPKNARGIRPTRRPSSR